jgi:UrcA family protein
MQVSNAIAGIATLALAAIPMFALGTAAHAAQPVVVQVADLDVSTAAGARELDRRINTAASQFCEGSTRLTENASCKAAVRAEVSDKMAARSAAVLYAAR